MAPLRVDFWWRLVVQVLALSFISWIVGTYHAQHAPVPMCNVGDGAILLEVKGGLIDLKTNFFGLWVFDCNCCEWPRVTYSSIGYLIALGPLGFTTRMITIVGALALGRLDNLESLQFGNSNFNPKIPKAWGQLRKLKVLSLNECQFFGPIPKDIGGMTSLQSITLIPPLVGPLPVNICKIANIEIMEMRSGITDYIPNYI